MSAAPARTYDRRPPQVRAVDISGRVPPHNSDAEEAVLSAILLDGKSLDELAFLESRDFYADAHARIFDAARAVAATGQPVDITTVAAFLRDRDQIQAIGGIAYLAKIVDTTPAVAHLAAHGRIVADKARVRRLIEACQMIAAEGFGDYGDAQSFIDAAEERVGEINGDQRSSMRSMREIVRTHQVELQSQWEGKRDPWGISFGRALPKLNGYMRGARPGEVIVVGADTGGGKTALVHQLVLDMVGRNYQGETVGALEIMLEMIGEDMVDRSLAIETNLGDFELQTGHFKHHDADGRVRRGSRLADATFAQIFSACRELESKPLLIDEGDQTIASIERSVRTAKRRLARDYHAALRVVALDHIGLVDDDDRDGVRALGRLCKAIRRIAINERVVMFVLCQFNRDGTKQERPPVLTDLKGGSAIEQIADKVVLIDRPELRTPTPTPEQKGLAKFYLPKIRKAGRVVVGAKYDGEHFRFFEDTPTPSDTHDDHD